MTQEPPRPDEASSLDIDPAPLPDSPPTAEPFGRLWRLDRVTVAILGLTALALITRVVGLDARAVHHDEALHLTYSWYYVEGRGYEHDPLMHGPLQFHLMAAFFWLFGDNEFVGRLPHAIAGTILVASPLLFRRYLNGTAMVLAAVFLLISPSLLYYTRFAREDPFVVLATIAGLAAILQYRADRRLRWLVVFSAALAFNFAAKETAYLFTAAFLLYLNAATAHELFWQPRRARGEHPHWYVQILHGLWLIPSAWVIAVLWPYLGRLRTRMGWNERPAELDLLVLTGALTLPLLAAVAEIPLMRGDSDFTLEEERTLAWAVIPILLLVSAAVGLAWGRLDFAICWVVFFGILIPLYSSMGTNWDGVAGIFWTSLDYWLDQHGVQRANQPWYFYGMLTPLYEGLVLLPGIIGGLWLTFRRRDRLAALMLWWAIAMFVTLSYAGEKMPWLVMHIALPLCFLAAHVLGGVWPRVRDAVRTGRGSQLAWASGGVAAVGLSTLFALTLWTDYGLNVDHPDTPIEPFMYAQTTNEMRVLSREVIEWKESGRAGTIVLDNDANLTWPWAWYLRDEGVEYLNRAVINDYDLSKRPIIIGDPSTWTRTVPDEWERRQYRHYEWPHESGYRSVTWASLARGLANGSLLEDWWQFLIERDPDSPFLYRDGVLIIPPAIDTNAQPAGPTPESTVEPSPSATGQVG